MASLYRNIAQTFLANATAVDLYTVPGTAGTNTTQAIVSTVTVCNQTAGNLTFTLAVRSGTAANAGSTATLGSSAAISTSAYVFYNNVVYANSSLVLTAGVTVTSGEVITVSASASGLSVLLFGTLIT